MISPFPHGEKPRFPCQRFFVPFFFFSETPQLQAVQNGRRIFRGALAVFVGFRRVVVASEEMLQAWERSISPTGR